MADRPTRLHVMNANDGSVVYRTKLSYDNYNNLSGFEEEVGNGSKYATTYVYDRDNRPMAVKFGAETEKVVYTYDALGRMATRKQYNGSSSAARNSATYSYLAGTQKESGYTSSTPLVSGISQTGVSFVYGYDGKTDNIASENRTGGSYAGTTTYIYDTLGQLTRVNDPKDTSSGSTGTTWVYNYDMGGNMMSKVRYAYTTGTLGAALGTTNYVYDSTWKDKLVNAGGYALTYDAIGNLKTYGGWTYTWEAGRQLKQQVQNSTVVTYEYDQNGMRVRKNVNGTVTNYTYNGKLLTHLSKGSDQMHFYYDAQGRPAMVTYNGVNYHYIHNLQGDVIALVDTNGAIVVEYKYNAWGSILGKTGSMASTLGYLNPFRYRGYVFDEETWMYYLQSRYYYPELQRFINADALLKESFELLGHNVFAYCGNNPIGRADENGAFWEELKDGLRKALVVAAGITAIALLSIATGGAGTLAVVAGYTAATGVAAAEATAIAAGAATVVAGMGYLFASTNKPNSNTKQNEQYRAVMRELGITKDNPYWRRIHDALHKAKITDAGYKELLRFAMDFLSKHRK